MSFLQEYPDLRPFVLTNVRPTGRLIGSGSYGSVEEVEMPGATCAAKKIHNFFQDPSRVPPEGMEKALRQFVRECGLMSTLRHPHIVQFLGVYLLPGSRVPALVMERLDTSLHDVLDPEPPPFTKTFVPVGLKCSILHDVASGLCFLHSHSPPIIHRDLSARNILLTRGMEAKISDLGMARIVPSLRAATMTKAPGASIYMPPEALEDESRYDVTIDVFSFGVLTVFALSQTFPRPLAAAYMNPGKVIVGRTELQRRDSYIQQIRSELNEGHPLIKMIQKCLSNLPEERPKANALFQFLEQARAKISDDKFSSNKLSLIQSLKQTTELLRKSDKLLQQKSSEVESLNQQISSMGALIESQRTQIEQLQRKLQKIPDVRIARSDSIPTVGSSNPEMRWPLPLQWRKGKDIPTGLCTACAVIIDDVVYCGGNSINSSDVAVYTPVTGKWNLLPPSPVCDFFMTSLGDQLVLVGGSNASDEDVNAITVWDGECGRWTNPYPPMPTARSQAAAVGYKKYLVVACGFPGVATVEVLDSSTGRWYTSQPLPVAGCKMSAAVVGDSWYLSSFGKWDDGREHVFQAHLPTLISNLFSHSRDPVWLQLPTPPVQHPVLMALRGHLLLVGGVHMCISIQLIHRYDATERRWRECGQLSLPLSGVCATELPSGELMVAGGLSGETKLSNTIMIGIIQTCFQTRN